MIVGKADGEIGLRSLKTQRREALFVQVISAAAERLVVAFPVADRIGSIDARGGEDRVPQSLQGGVLRHVGEHGLRPGRRRVGDDVPVDVEIDDVLERRTIRRRSRAVDPCDLLGILRRQQRWILADDSEARRAAGKCRGHAVEQPAAGLVEALVGCIAEALQRQQVVRQQRRDQRRSGLVGVRGDPPDQRQRLDRRRDHQFLTLLQLQPDLDRHFGETIETLFEIRHLTSRPSLRRPGT